MVCLSVGLKITRVEEEYRNLQCHPMHGKGNTGIYKIKISHIAFLKGKNRRKGEKGKEQEEEKGRK